MDKASIIKDAIDYIQELHEQERRIQADIMELEGGRMSSSGNSNYHPVGGELYGVDFDPDLQLYLRSKKKRTDLGYDCGGGSRTSPIEDLEVSPLHPPPSFSSKTSQKISTERFNNSWLWWKAVGLSWPRMQPNMVQEDISCPVVHCDTLTDRLFNHNYAGNNNFL